MAMNNGVERRQAEGLRRAQVLVRYRFNHWAEYMARTLANAAKETQPSAVDLTIRFSAGVGNRKREYGPLLRQRSHPKPPQSLADFTHEGFVDDTAQLRDSITHSIEIREGVAHITIIAATEYAAAVEDLHGYKVISHLQWTTWPELLKEFEEWISDMLQGGVASEVLS